MSLEGLAGRVYGPLARRVSHAKVAEYVAATGDDPVRWATAAPPSYAAALLFTVAPLLIADPEVGENARVLVHTDQHFRWRGPLLVGAPVTVSGTVTKVRGRGDLHLVTLEVIVSDPSGAPVVESTSTFLMGSGAAATPGPDTGEPPVGAGGAGAASRFAGPVVEGAALPTVERAASRLDLVRYAAASGDFNPIHFDHEAARSAGLDGIVVHGLLMAAWLAQLAVATADGDAPLAEMRLRFRNALRPAVVATAGGTIASVSAGAATLDLALRRGETDLVTAQAVTHA